MSADPSPPGTGPAKRTGRWPRQITRDEVLARLTVAVHQAGGVRAYARQIKCSAAYISDILNKRRDPGVKVLGPLGISAEKRITVSYTYRAKR